jgi:hypothetical protein
MKFIGSLVLVLILLVLLIGYPIVKTRYAPSVKTAADLAGDTKGELLYPHVKALSVEIGSRSVFETERIDAARDYILGVLKNAEIPHELQPFEFDGKTYGNIVVELPGETIPGEIILFGAHYDSVLGTPGADDNASGVAVLLEMCRALKERRRERTIRLVFFALEEHPMFNTPYMGSHVHASEAKRKEEDIRIMASLEMLGYFSDKEGGQSFPLPFMSRFYPTMPNFIGVVGDKESKAEVEIIARALRRTGLPVETISASRLIPGINLSDHDPFWKMGFKALMITDTAFYRNPNYHTAHDTIDTLDFTAMSRVCAGLIEAAVKLASDKTEVEKVRG